MKLERRAYRTKLECRLYNPDLNAELDPGAVDADDLKLPRIVGHAAVFNQAQDIYGMFYEVFEPGCFSATLKDASIPVVACVNHDMDEIPLARYVYGNPNNTLNLSEDETGLLADFLPIGSERGEEVVESIKRGDMDGMSITFLVMDADYSGIMNGLPLRRVTAAQLFDVTVTQWPMFPQTDVSVRNKNLGSDMSKADYQAVIDAHTQVSEQQRLEALQRRSKYIDLTLRNKAP